jgi:N-methylhydantoinase A
MTSIGIDVGGTFTDFALHDGDAGGLQILKRSSSADPTDSIVEGVAELCAQAGLRASEVDLVIHGTTVATNALLEDKGAQTGMVTNEGFRDVIHIGRHQRPQNYSIQQDIPWQVRPLVDRALRFGVSGRIAPPDGVELRPLDEVAVREAAATMRREGVTAVAVCFLFSYLDPAHERQAAEILAEEMPDAFVCTSHSVVSQFREFERFTTTSLNAFVGPSVRAYLERLAERLGALGVTAPLHIMQSNGGTATPAAARERPVSLLLSGPVGGVTGGVEAAGDRRPIVTLDVGGTSADIAVVTEEGVVEARSRDAWVAGYPVLAPMIDIETIGSGGGSIAYLDDAGGLHVGPRSAGAQPGPACYGRGGSEPTVTDANVVLGRLPGTLAGGLRLDRGLAIKAVGGLADQLGVEPLECAAGIVRIMNESMAAAMRIKTIQRGLDPRDFLLVAFGGGGPLQAAELAGILEIPGVLIPPNPGVTSAAGLLSSDLRIDVSVSILRSFSELEPAALDVLFRRLEDDVRTRLDEQGAPGAVSVERATEVRYVGQSHELRVPVQAGRVDAGVLRGLAESFDALHEQEFGHRLVGAEIELVNVRLTGVGEVPHPSLQVAAGGPLEEAIVDEVDVTSTFDGALRTMAAPVYDRNRFPVGSDVRGPAVLVQLDATTFVPPSCSVRREEDGSLRMTIGDGTGGA